MNFQKSIFELATHVMNLTGMGTQSAWGWIVISDLMVRAITDGFTMEFAVTDGNEIFSTDDINDLVGAVEFALTDEMIESAVVF